MKQVTRKKTILIAGYGNIGKLEYEVYKKKFDASIYDKFKEGYNDASVKDQLYDFCIICVDTPLKDGELDISAVEDVITSVKANIFISRSTLPVGSTEYLNKKYNAHLVMVPEFYGTTQHANNFEFDFTILGGDKEDCLKCQQMYQELYDGRHTFRIVDGKTAEIAKFMENSYLAMKVSFCAEFWRICQEFGAHYEEVRECMKLDPRFGGQHSFIYDEHPYWTSHCLDKDVPSIANQSNSMFLKDMIKFNEYMKHYNEEE